MKADVVAVLGSLSDLAPREPAPPEDMERTVATPSAGYQTGARPSRVLDTPLTPSTPLRQTQGGAADVRLRTSGGSLAAVDATAAHAAERGPALRVFLAAAVVVLAGVAAFWIYGHRKAARPAPGNGGAVPASTATAAPEPAAAPSASATAPATTSETATASPRAPPSRRFRRRPPSRRPCRSRRGP